MDSTLIQTLIAIAAPVLLILLIFALKAARRKNSGAETPGRAAASEPVIAPPPVSPRRRQLVPLSVSEATDGLESIETPPADLGPNLIGQTPADVHAVLQDGPELEAPATPFYEETLGALEALFERFGAGDITLSQYVAQIQTHERAVAERCETLADQRGDATVDKIALEQEIDDVLCARDAVRWCLDWADALEQEQRAANDDAQSDLTVPVQANRIAAGPSAAK